MTPAHATLPSTNHMKLAGSAQRIMCEPASIRGRTSLPSRVRVRVRARACSVCEDERWRGERPSCARALREVSGIGPGRDMNACRTVRVVQMLAAAVAGLFGVATLFAGGRVLLGSDPGYVVLRPLLIYNTTMGVAYLAAGVTIWRSVIRGTYAAGAIFLLNLFVLLGIVLVYRNGGAVAVDSLRTMTLRTVVWLVLYLALFWLARAPDFARPPGAERQDMHRFRCR